MLAVALPEECDEHAFRAAARRCLARGLPPEQVLFTTGQTGSLFDQAAAGEAHPEAAGRVQVPRRFSELVAKVLCHSAADRFALLYRMLWRIGSGERELLGRLSDPDVIRAQEYAQAVERDVYRMQAFVRFGERRIDGRAVFVAWYEPRYRILRRAAGFFVDRFTNMDWLIATPLGTVAWREGELRFRPPAARPAREGDAVLDELWTAYYRATFNPARLRVKAMVAQMPKRHWPTLPESALIPGLVQSAGARVEAMSGRPPDPAPRFAAALARRPEDGPPAPVQTALDVLRQEAEGCRRCPLHGPATQTVFGEGPEAAPIMFVGEQPGDGEDLSGRPFVGPAGQVFARALAEAGIERSRVYLTNAVKHFKFEPRGKRRIHSKPGRTEVVACSFWLKREVAAIRPRLVVALGATAALSLTGRSVAVTRLRGRIVSVDGLRMLVTIHPSYLLRLPDPALAQAEYERLVQDLKVARCVGVPEQLPAPGESDR
jgi:uracil-DNA glycosylase